MDFYDNYLAIFDNSDFCEQYRKRIKQPYERWYNITKLLNDLDHAKTCPTVQLG